MIWKDRIKQYPHRYTLTNVSGSTYDFTEVTGEVTEAGTPVSAENMNKLLQRDGDDIKDTVTTFTEATTRDNIATGENTSTIFGKIKKWFTDLKPHAFANLSTVYDIVIKTQAEFEALIADPTWFDAQSVAFVGQFTLSTPDNSGVKRPANVTRIDGYNNAKITVTNFVYNLTTARGGLWDDADINNPCCYINDLTVDCASAGYASYGFSGNNNTYTNCTGTGTSASDGYGFRGNNNTYTNCTGTGTSASAGYASCGFSGNNNTYTNCRGTGTSASAGYGFFGDNNSYTNCTGTGTSASAGDGYGFRGDNNSYTNCTGTGTSARNGDGYGFRGNNNTYTNCTGTGTGGSASIGANKGYGFFGNNNRIISCTALAYLATNKTPSDTNCVPIYNSSTSTNLFMIIRDCKFPQIAKTGYQQGTIWCNIANNTTMVGSIKDNVYHSRFTVAPIKGENVVADNNSAVNITAI